MSQGQLTNVADSSGAEVTAGATRSIAEPPRSLHLGEVKYDSLAARGSTTAGYIVATEGSQISKLFVSLVYIR